MKPFLFTLTRDLKGAGRFEGIRAKRSGDKILCKGYVMAYFDKPT